MQKALTNIAYSSIVEYISGEFSGGSSSPYDFGLGTGRSSEVNGRGESDEIQNYGLIPLLTVKLLTFLRWLMSLLLSLLLLVLLTAGGCWAYIAIYRYCMPNVVFKGSIVMDYGTAAAKSSATMTTDDFIVCAGSIDLYAQHGDWGEYRYDGEEDGTLHKIHPDFNGGWQIGGGCSSKKAWSGVDDDYIEEDEDGEASCSGGAISHLPKGRDFGEIIRQGTEYYFHVSISFPKTETNSAMGVTMLQSTLSDSSNIALGRSRRSLLPPRYSSIVSLMKSTIFAPVYIFASDRGEEEVTTVEIFDRWVEGKGTRRIQHLKLEVLKSAKAAASPEITHMQVEIGEEFVWWQKIFRDNFWIIGIVFVSFVLAWEGVAVVVIRGFIVGEVKRMGRDYGSEGESEVDRDNLDGVEQRGEGGGGVRFGQTGFPPSVDDNFEPIDTTPLQDLYDNGVPVVEEIEEEEVDNGGVNGGGVSGGVNGGGVSGGVSGGVGGGGPEDDDPEFIRIRT